MDNKEKYKNEDIEKIEEVRVIGEPICKFCNKPKREDRRFMDMLRMLTYYPCECKEAIKERELIKKKEEEEEKQRILFENTRTINKLSKNGNITDELRKKSFDSFKPRNEKEATTKTLIINYSKDLKLANKVGLYLFGNKGTGKTHLALSIANTVIDKLGRAIYLTSGELKDRLNGYINKNYYRDKQSYQICKLLILDGLGDKTTLSDNYLDNLFQIIDYRNSNKLPTIITSNFNLKELYNRLRTTDEQQASNIVDRITELCNQLYFDGVSYRR